MNFPHLAAKLEDEDTAIQANGSCAIRPPAAISQYLRDDQSRNVQLENFGIKRNVRTPQCASIDCTALAFSIRQTDSAQFRMPTPLRGGGTTSAEARYAPTRVQ